MNISVVVGIVVGIVLIVAILLIAMRTQTAYCPYCDVKLGRHDWLATELGKSYVGYCQRCQMAFKADEVVWK